MKKKYQVPEIEIIEFELETIIATSPGTNLPGVDGGENGGDTPDEADGNRHRGEWGNLWAED